MMFVLIQVVAFLVVIGILVAVHEYGHFWVARRLGFTVLRFSLGFGKRLWTHTGRDGVEYALSAIPLGGYVKLLDEREGPVAPEARAGAFQSRPIWARIAVLLAGPGANFLFALLLFWLLLMHGVPGLKPVVGPVAPGSLAASADLRPGDEIVSVARVAVVTREDALLAMLSAALESGRIDLGVRRDGLLRPVTLEVPETRRRALSEPGAFGPGIGFQFTLPHLPVVIGRVVAGGSAAVAGLRVGDEVTAVDAVPVTEFFDFRNIISNLPGKTVRLTVRRDNALLTLPVEVRSEVDEASAGHPRVGRIGIAPGGEASYPAEVQVLARFGPLAAVRPAIGEFWSKSSMTVAFLWRMVVGQVSLKNMSGPIGIASYAGASALAGLATFGGFLAVISLSLGILNLLPIPILDGGQVVYQLAEAARGGPLPERVHVWGQQIGIVLLVLMMSIAFYNDIARHFG
jgi:regulator of sigma E protease